MKWIALQSSEGGSVEIVRLEHVFSFTCGASGEGLLARREGDSTARYEIPAIKPYSPAGQLLAQLNGPVGEVPYK